MSTQNEIAELANVLHSAICDSCKDFGSTLERHGTLYTKMAEQLLNSPVYKKYINDLRGDDIEYVINEFRITAAWSQKLLQTAIINVCPGPHELKQHRDHKPPWCPNCGRDRQGIVQKDVAK